jgi:hypothetical protein
MTGLRGNENNPIESDMGSFGRDSHASLRMTGIIVDSFEKK